jgi:hypothetical protein
LKIQRVGHKNQKKEKKKRPLTPNQRSVCHTWRPGMEWLPIDFGCYLINHRLAFEAEHQPNIKATSYTLTHAMHAQTTFLNNV